MVRLRDETVVGYEALARWNHPEEGWISPDRFIPVAESTGLIGEIGDLVCRRACAEVARHGEGEVPAYIAVNVSPVQIRGVDFVDAIRARREAAGLSPERLELEITEQALLNMDPVILARLDELRRQGVRVAIDDFGTGFSSLSYLRHLPVDRLKVDRTFVRDLPNDRGNQAILAAIVTLAREFGLDLTAEGVETRAEADQLRSLGCETAQGFLFDRPRIPDPE